MIFSWSDSVSCLSCFDRECPVDVMCNRFSDDGSLLAVGLIDGSIKVRNND